VAISEVLDIFQYTMQRPVLVVLTGTAGKMSPVVVKLVESIVVDIVREVSFPPVIIPLAVAVIGAIATRDAASAVVASFPLLSFALWVVAVELASH
jgi:hypothetical protein